jgi:hypothetical protein
MTRQIARGLGLEAINLDDLDSSMRKRRLRVPMLNTGDDDAQHHKPRVQHNSKRAISNERPWPAEQCRRRCNTCQYRSVPSLLLAASTLALGLPLGHYHTASCPAHCCHRTAVSNTSTPRPLTSVRRQQRPACIKDTLHRQCARAGQADGHVGGKSSARARGDDGQRTHWC